MSLEIAKLEKVRELAGGIVQARCPACAEGGHDRTGEHLRIYADGRFGCCVHPQDREHRKRIFALAGRKTRAAGAGNFSLRIKTPPALPATTSVKAALTAFTAGTLGTAKSELVAPVPEAADGVEPESGESGTLGTAKVKLRACARVDSTTTNIDTPYFLGELKDSETVVPSVPTAVAAEPLSAAGQRLPFLTADGTLSIPFDSPERYHWWRDGQSIAQTRAEISRKNTQPSY